MPDRILKKRITTIPFSQEKPHTFMQLLCDGIIVRDAASFEELVAFLRSLQSENPSHRVLTSLDDLGQACYTCGHTTDKHNLDDIEGHDVAQLNAAVFEDGEHLGYLSTESEFPIRLGNLLKQSADVQLSDLAGQLPWWGDCDKNGLISANAKPDETLLFEEEKDFVVQLVPVARAADALAAFPNGYFVADLNPMQNHALSLHLETNYGFGLFAVGSRFLGFWRDQPLEDEIAKALAGELVALYRQVPAGATQELASGLAGKDLLLIRYTES
jgi:hypothetical protein